MTETPPTTPSRQKILVTPAKYLEGQAGNEENALNFANTPRRSKPDHSKQQSISYQGGVVLGNDLPAIEQTSSLESDTTSSDLSVARLKGLLDDFGKQNRAHYEKYNPNDIKIQNTPSMDSDCESDVSVARLKGWLDDFGKQNHSHYEKVNNIGKAPKGIALTKPKSAIAPTSQPAVSKPVIRRHTDPIIASAEAKKGPAKTPVRFKPRYKKDEVQATNDGYASVKKIAAWLADDPTANKKKMTTVRKGINVINKSRMFEKDLENVIIEESRIIRGSVSNKKEFFQTNAFNDDEDKCEALTCVSVTDKKKWLESAFGGKKPAEKEPEDDDDSIVSMSVLDKKAWLQNTFKNSEIGRDQPTTPARFADKAKRAASAPGVPTMTPVRNEAAVNLVKEKFLERAASRRSLSGTSDAPQVKSQPEEEATAPIKHKWQQCAAHTPLLPEPIEPSQTEQVKLPESPKTPVRQPQNSTVARWNARKAEKEASSPVKTGASPTKVAASAVKRSVVSTDEKVSIEEKARVTVEAGTRSWKAREATKATESPVQAPGISSDEKAAIEENVGFKAAREKLIQRSAQNGNPVTVLSKVQMRKQKFEQMQQEVRRSTHPKGLLKPVWEMASTDVGPTTAYKKTFVDNIAPKKSFEDLP